MSEKLLIPNGQKSRIVRLLWQLGIDYKWYTHDIMLLSKTDFQSVISILDEEIALA